MSNVLSVPLKQVDKSEILYKVNSLCNFESEKVFPNKIRFSKQPICLDEYTKGFNCVKNNLKKGNTYLTNYTAKSAIETNLTLKQIFYISEAKYKLWFNDQFVVFSPETFIKIIDGKIYGFPMKGTINANIPNAQQKILSDKKETAEHATIVDLIRNDLSKVAKNVTVDKYRYIDTIKTNNGDILQVSSQISGNLNDDYCENLGGILKELLPAGSITGAPKTKTIEIIKNAETYQRGFYTGVFGIFDGKTLDCGVMIRFIERENESLFFKSGGGITINSSLNYEYEEMIQKIYLPSYF